MGGVFLVLFAYVFFFSRSFLCLFNGRCLVAWLNYKSRRGLERVGVAWEKSGWGVF